MNWRSANPSEWSTLRLNFAAFALPACIVALLLYTLPDLIKQGSTNDWPLTQGSVVASDAFFPFADGLIAAAEAGATAIIQPGGSMRDADVIAAADARGLAMVFTGMRHFRH